MQHKQILAQRGNIATCRLSATANFPPPHGNYADTQCRILCHCLKDRRKTPVLSEELSTAAFDAERKRVHNTIP